MGSLKVSSKVPPIIRACGLTDTAESEPAALYQSVKPSLPLGLPFEKLAVSDGWSNWPSLPDLFPSYFPGVVTNRDSFLVDIDTSRLETRIDDYFNSELSHDEITHRYPVAMKNTSSIHLTARQVRDIRLGRGPNKQRFIRYSFRPFDTRWLYWEEDSGLLARPSPDYRPHVFDGNLALVSQQKPRREWSPPQVTSAMGCYDLMDRNVSCFPIWLRDEQTEGQQAMLDGGEGRRPNLSAAAQAYLDRLGLGAEDLFHHALAVLHDPDYREANSGALRMEWPRIPLPGWPDGDAPDAADELPTCRRNGAANWPRCWTRRRQWRGVTTGTLRTELAAIAVPSTPDGRNMTGDDFALTAGWGHFGSGRRRDAGAGPRR